MTSTPEVGPAVPASQKSGWSSFLKNIASMSGDLSSLTAPPFILSPISLTEYPSYWCEYPELFNAIPDGKTQADRSSAVLKWFISTLKGQYTSRNDSMGSEKKPLNPVLGEVFYGTWPDYGLSLLVEQVSHHPPITAYRIENKDKGLVLEGHSAQKTSFSAGSIIVKQIGHAILTVKPSSGGDQEQYLITLPRLRIDGLWYGSPYIELSDSSYIASSTGFVSTIEYKGKGYFGGKTHSFKATTVPPASSSAADVIAVEGTWHLNSKYTKSGLTFHDVSIAPKHVVQVKPVHEQGEWESRRLWSTVAGAIRAGNFDLASKDKSRIENDQRQKRRDEKAAGETWKLKHFTAIDSDPIYAQLGKLFKATPATEDAYRYTGNGPV